MVDITKVFRGFTIDVGVYEAARRTLPNMSEAVENALREATEARTGQGESNPFSGIPKRLLSKAASVLSKDPIEMEQRAPHWARVIDKKCGVQVNPQDLINYVHQTEFIR